MRIARQLRVARQTVARWVQQYRLSEKQQRRLKELLQLGPERLGYGSALWTCPRVAHLIEREFGVRYHQGHVWKLWAALDDTEPPPRS